MEKYKIELAKKIIKEDIINCMEWEFDIEKNITNGMIKFHNSLCGYCNNKLSQPVEAVVMQKIADTKKEFDEKFVPYKPYYQTQRGIIYWSDLWKWFEEKLSNFTA